MLPVKLQVRKSGLSHSNELFLIHVWTEDVNFSFLNVFFLQRTLDKLFCRVIYKELIKTVLYTDIYIYLLKSMDCYYNNMNTKALTLEDEVCIKRRATLIFLNNFIIYSWIFVLWRKTHQHVQNVRGHRHS